VDRVRPTRFDVVLRGYDRNAVDKYVADVAKIVAELETTQLRENVVQRALDEVGEQTSSILQRAHQTAEEIETRSRSQAEGRLQRAEQEAELLRRDAERYAEELASETQRLWEDRMRLIEDMRQLADEVLSVADDALERLPEPEALLGGSEEQAPPELPAEIDDEEDADTTVEAEPVPLPDTSDGSELGNGEDPEGSTVGFPGPEEQPDEQPQRDRQG
jgi:cell division initiation protein